MALDLFAVAAPGQARCRQPDARGLKDLAQLGMRVAFKIGGTKEAAAADLEAFGGPVVHVTDPLVARYEHTDLEQPDVLGTTGYRVNHTLVQTLVREMISHAAGRRPSVVYCADGVTDTGLVVAALRLALSHPAEEVMAEREYFRGLLRPSTDPWLVYPESLSAQDAYLRELAAVSRPRA